MVYTLGESLLDIIISSPESVVAKAGGSMLNTAVSLGRCGIKTSMVSETGDDMTAKMILKFLEENGVKTSLIKKYYHQKTSVALAFLDEDKKPVYSIHKSYPENRLIIAPHDFHENDIVAFGSLFSLDPSIRNDISILLSRAKNKGCILIYDPNIRSHSIEKGPVENAFLENTSFASIIKASDEDLKNIFGEINLDESISKLLAVNPDSIVIVTLGEKGAMVVKKNISIKVPAKTIQVVSTVGAGDAFNAGIIYYLSKYKRALGNLDDIGEERLHEMLETGVMFSSAVCESLENYVPSGFDRKLSK